MPFVDAYHVRKSQEVMEETWSHLRAKRGTRFRGHMTFATSLYDYGAVAVIEFEFGDLEDSPWLYQDIQDLVDKFSDEKRRGRVYRFVGEYVVYKNGQRRFVGKTRQVRLRLPQKRAKP
jgi:hypothetical protein